MQGRSLVCVTFSVLLGILSCTAVAQELRTPEPEFFGQSDPAPAWAVWAAFHRSLQHQARQSAVLPASLLQSRAGIAEGSTLRIMSLGEDYLRTLQRLQDERRRLGGLAPVAVPQGDLRAHLTPPVERRAPTEADLALQAMRTPLRLPRSEAGGGQADVPQQREDPVAAFDASARSALAEHQQQLVGLIGARDYAALEHWIASEFGEQVRVPRRAYPLSSPDAQR